MEQRFDIRQADVFVSFTGADREIKNKIIGFLKEKNISCLESDEECCGNYNEWSIEAPRHCSLFLPIITANIKQESIMKDEFESVTKVDDYKNRIVPISTNMEVYKKYSFGMHEFCSAVFYDNLEQIKEQTLEAIYHRIELLLIHRKCRERFNPPEPSKYFVGRNAEVKEIHEKLKKTNNIFISGVGGVGKTELVKKYAADDEKIFSNIIFLQYNTNYGNCASSDLEGKVRIVTEEMPFASGYAVFNNPETLVILDNFDIEEDDYLDTFLSFNCKKVITTRNSKFVNYENAECIILGTLSDIEQSVLFKKHYGYDIDADDKDLNDILRGISGLTVFIPIIAKQCCVSGWDLNTMSKKLKGEGISSFENFEHIRMNSKKGNTLDFARKIFKIASLSEEHQKVLRNLSLLQFMHVKKVKYKEICNEKNLNILNDLIEKNWVIENRGGFSPVAVSVDLHPIINDLVRVDLAPNPENCPEVFKYMSEFDEICNKIFDEDNFISPWHISLLPKEERTEFCDAFINNLDVSNKQNYRYISEMIDLSGIDGRNLNTEIKEKLKKIVLDICNSCECLGEVDARIVHLLLLSGKVDKAEIKEMLEKCYEGLVQDKITWVLAKAILFSACTRTNIKDGDEVFDKYMCEIHKKESQDVFEGKNILLTQCESENHNEDRIIAEELNKLNFSRQQLLQEKNKLRTFVAIKLLTARSFKDAYEFLLSDKNRIEVLDEEILYALFVKFFIENREDEVQKFLYNEFSWQSCMVSEYAELIDYTTKGMIFKTFLTALKSAGKKGLDKKTYFWYIEEALAYRGCNSGLTDKDTLVDIIADYYSGNEQVFQGKITEYFTLTEKSGSMSDRIDGFFECQAVLEECFQICSQTLLQPVARYAQNLIVPENGKKSYVIYQIWYRWAYELAEKCGDERRRAEYLEKYRTVKEKRLGYRLK